MTLTKMGENGILNQTFLGSILNFFYSYIIVRKLLSNPEVVKLRDCMEQSKDILKYAHGRADDTGIVRFTFNV